MKHDQNRSVGREDAVDHHVVDVFRCHRGVRRKTVTGVEFFSGAGRSPGGVDDIFSFFTEAEDVALRRLESVFEKTLASFGGRLRSPSRPRTHSFLAHRRIFLADARW